LFRISSFGFGFPFRGICDSLSFEARSAKKSKSDIFMRSLKTNRIFTLFFTVMILFAFGSLAAESRNAEIDVILWFDTEDYLLPADDDASKRLAELLTERGIRATFKLVGEKARVLEKRGRLDVIAALKKHDIGYHSDFHSVHPTPAEYLADCNLLDGVAEFVRREGDGAADVRRIFGLATLSCYGQPGSSWGSQTIAGLKQIGVAPSGIPCYVDEGTHIGLNGKPFWYAGALVVYDMQENWTRMDLHDPAAVEPAKRKVAAIAERLRTKENGGLISIFYHPCEWVHKEFWDGVNFRRGANPPREQWKPPPQRSAAETEAAFKRFAEYIDSIRSLPGVKFVTASDLPTLYPDRTRTEGAAKSDLLEIAQQIRQREQTGVDFYLTRGKAYSLADQFELLISAVTGLLEGKSDSVPVPATGVLGPDSPPPAPGQAPNELLAWPAFRDAVLDVRDYLRRDQRIPARVFIGADPISPVDFLIGLASTYEFHSKNGRLPIAEGVSIGRDVQILPAQHVAKDTPDLFGGWIIHKEGFRAPKILEVARLQAWTLKPALR
jgi:hypothetical protein